MSNSKRYTITFSVFLLTSALWLILTACGTTDPTPTAVAILATGEPPTIVLDKSGQYPLLLGATTSVTTTTKGQGELTVEWVANCSKKGPNCPVLKSPTRDSVFVTATETVDELIIVIATVMDENRQKSKPASITFRVVASIDVSPPTNPPPNTRAATSVPGEITLNVDTIKNQDSTDGGWEYFFDLRNKRSYQNTVPPINDGVDLSAYNLEFTFRTIPGKQIQLTFKNNDGYKTNSCKYQDIPTADAVTITCDANSGPFDEQLFSDPTHIYLVGLKVFNSRQADTQVISARLLKVR